MDVRRHRLAGFGLLEVILVFAIVIGAAAVVFTVFQSSSDTSEVSEEVSRVGALVGNLQGAYGAQKDFTPLGNDGWNKSTQRAIQGGLVPASMIGGTDILKSPWGQAYVGGPSPGGQRGSVVQTRNDFEIYYPALPPAACMRFVPAVANLFVRQVTVNGTFIMVNGKLDASLLPRACNDPFGSPTVYIVFLW